MINVTGAQGRSDPYGGTGHLSFNQNIINQHMGGGLGLSSEYNQGTSGRLGGGMQERPDLEDDEDDELGDEMDVNQRE